MNAERVKLYFEAFAQWLDGLFERLTGISGSYITYGAYLLAAIFTALILYRVTAAYKRWKRKRMGKVEMPKPSGVKTELSSSAKPRQNNSDLTARKTSGAIADGEAVEAEFADELFSKAPKGKVKVPAQFALFVAEQYGKDLMVSERGEIVFNRVSSLIDQNSLNEAKGFLPQKQEGSKISLVRVNKNGEVADDQNQNAAKEQAKDQEEVIKKLTDEKARAEIELQKALEEKAALDLKLARLGGEIGENKSHAKGITAENNDKEPAPADKPKTENKQPETPSESKPENKFENPPVKSGGNGKEKGDDKREEKDGNKIAPLPTKQRAQNTYGYQAPIVLAPESNTEPALNTKPKTDSGLSKPRQFTLSNMPCSFTYSRESALKSSRAKSIIWNSSIVKPRQYPAGAP